MSSHTKKLRKQIIDSFKDEQKYGCHYKHCLNACEHPCATLDYAYKVSLAHAQAINAARRSNIGDERHSSKNSKDTV